MLGFAASADFAEDKPPHTPCRHLRRDFRCSIHAELPERGYPGCVAYDCQGAGQLVTQITFGGADWRSSPALAPAMFGAFEVVRRLQELRWYLGQALALGPAAPLRPDLTAALEEVGRLTRLDPDGLVALDDAPVHRRVAELLGRASELVRATVAGAPAGPGRRGRSGAGRDLLGADLRGTDLSGADLRGALLIAADLRGARLDRTDLLGADLRDADVRGTDLSRALFLTRAQLGATRGNAATVGPAGLDRPPGWDRAG